ncbi:hypothetical protein VTN96DRAFT_3213 [Rasamsonia emersonii]
MYMLLKQKDGIFFGSSKPDETSSKSMILGLNHAALINPGGHDEAHAPSLDSCPSSLVPTGTIYLELPSFSQYPVCYSSS